MGHVTSVAITHLGHLAGQESDAQMQKLACGTLLQTQAVGQIPLKACSFPDLAPKGAADRVRCGISRALSTPDGGQGSSPGDEQRMCPKVTVPDAQSDRVQTGAGGG